MRTKAKSGEDFLAVECPTCGAPTGIWCVCTECGCEPCRARAQGVKSIAGGGICYRGKVCSARAGLWRAHQSVMAVLA